MISRSPISAKSVETPQNNQSRCWPKQRGVVKVVVVAADAAKVGAAKNAAVTKAAALEAIAAANLRRKAVTQHSMQLAMFHLRLRRPNPCDQSTSMATTRLNLSSHLIHRKRLAPMLTAMSIGTTSTVERTRSMTSAGASSFTRSVVVSSRTRSSVRSSGSVTIARIF